jgi:hypothetical protein
MGWLEVGRPPSLQEPESLGRHIGDGFAIGGGE